MFKVVCMICKKEFFIPHWDYRYREMKYTGRMPRCVCERCNHSIQNEAVHITGINPDEIDREDRFLRGGGKKS